MSLLPVSDAIQNASLFGGSLETKHSKFDKLEKVKDIKLTMRPHVEMKRRKKKIGITIDGKPGISLSGKVIADEYNLGPFIEELTYRITPLKNAHFLEAKPAGTAEKQVSISNNRNVSQTITLSDDGPSGSVTTGKAVNFTGTENDFVEEVRRISDTIEWKKRLNLCQNDGVPVKYDPINSRCLIKSRSGERWWSLLPMAFGGQSCCPADLIGDVCEAAKSSLAFSTEANYELDDEQAQAEFMVEFDATVVFLSNELKWESSSNPVLKNLNEKRYFERTTHKVAYCWTVPPQGSPEKLLKSNDVDSKPSIIIPTDRVAQGVYDFIDMYI